LVLGIVAVLEIGLALCKIRGPIRRLLGAFFDSDARLSSFEKILLSNALFFAVTLWYFSAAFTRDPCS
jgi:hypothetical protein